jgi:uncharacterized protein
MIESAASLSELTKVASLRAVGLCFDEVACNTKMLQEVDGKRRTNALLKVMGGSLTIKMLVIPAALVVNTFIPGAILPLLTFGGFHLASEGMKMLRGKEDKDEAPGHAAHKGKTPEQVEKDRIKKVLIVDGLLSVEITVMTLSVIAGLPALAAAGVLAATGVIRTAWMYGLIGGIINMDRAGKWLSERKGDIAASKIARSVGKSMNKAVPYIVKGFSVAGTVALLMIGGGLLIHGIPGGEHLMTSALGHITTNGMALGLMERAVGTVVGIGAGYVGVPVLDRLYHVVSKGCKAVAKLVSRPFKKKKADDKAPKVAPTLAAAPEAAKNALKNAPDVKADLNAAAKPPSNDNAPAPAAEAPQITLKPPAP